MVALHGLPLPPNSPLPFPSYFLLPCAHLAPATPAFLLRFTQARQDPASGILYLMLFSQITTSLQSLSLGARSQCNLPRYSPLLFPVLISHFYHNFTYLSSWSVPPPTLCPATLEAPGGQISLLSPSLTTVS